jgi:hypothetical protein
MLSVPTGRPRVWQPSDSFGNIVAGAFTLVRAKHSKSFSLVDAISVGVDRMQWNFEPMRKQVEAWRQTAYGPETASGWNYAGLLPRPQRSR